MPGCLALVSELPEAVYKACDLIVAVAGRNGKEWRDRVIGEILSKVITVQMYCTQPVTVLLRLPQPCGKQSLGFVISVPVPSLTQT